MVSALGLCCFVRLELEVEVLSLSESVSHIAPQISLLIARSPETIREYICLACMNMNITICSEDLLNPLKRTSNVA